MEKSKPITPRSLNIGIVGLQTRLPSVNKNIQLSMPHSTKTKGRGYKRNQRGMVSLLVGESCVIIPDPVCRTALQSRHIFSLPSNPPCLAHPCSGLQDNSSFLSFTLDKKDPSFLYVDIVRLELICLQRESEHSKLAIAAATLKPRLNYVITYFLYTSSGLVPDCIP